MQMSYRVDTVAEQFLENRQRVELHDGHLGLWIEGVPQ